MSRDVMDQTGIDQVLHNKNYSNWNMTEKRKVITFYLYYGVSVFR